MVKVCANFSSAAELGVDWGIREAGGASEKEECTNVIALGGQEEDFGTSKKASIEVILKLLPCLRDNHDDLMIFPGK